MLPFLSLLSRHPRDFGVASQLWGRTPNSSNFWQSHSGLTDFSMCRAVNQDSGRSEIPAGPRMIKSDMALSKAIHLLIPSLFKHIIFSMPFCIGTLFVGHPIRQGYMKLPSCGNIT